MCGFLSLVLIALVLFQGGLSQLLDDECAGPELLTYRIVNGSYEYSAPFMASVYYRSKFLCGGTLIHKGYVLSAAHCFETFTEVNVHLGEIDRSCSAEDCPHVQRLGARAINHPGFPHSGYSDIALLKLYREVIFNEFIRPICIILDEDVTSDGVYTFSAYGWGVTEENKLSDRLKSVTLSRLNDCEYNICAGDASEGELPVNWFIRSSIIFNIIDIIWSIREISISKPALGGGGSVTRCMGLEVLDPIAGEASLDLTEVTLTPRPLDDLENSLLRDINILISGRHDDDQQGGRPANAGEAGKRDALMKSKRGGRGCSGHGVYTDVNRFKLWIANNVLESEPRLLTEKCISDWGSKVLVRLWELSLFQHNFSGALITREFVLTVSVSSFHRDKNAVIYLIYIFVSRRQVKSRFLVNYDVAWFHLHPEFASYPSIKNNIAVIKLANKLPRSVLVAPICMGLNLSPPTTWNAFLYNVTDVFGGIQSVNLRRFDNCYANTELPLEPDQICIEKPDQSQYESLEKPGSVIGTIQTFKGMERYLIAAIISHTLDDVIIVTNIQNHQKWIANELKG
nr:uncharacterized protein LOC108063407 [Drosophila takahashii]